MLKHLNKIFSLHKRFLIWFLVFVCAFALLSYSRFFFLEAQWSSDEILWLNRSLGFMEAVSQGEFSKTVVAYHPGVTTNWIAGLRVLSKETALDVPNNTQARVFIHLVRSRWLIGIFVLFGIGIACLLVYQLFGRWIALSSFAFLSYSPFFLAQTRRVHTDALATVFILLTVLLFLLYCENRERTRYLFFSGITFGLAVLSKSYTLILCAWIPFCIFLYWKTEDGENNKSSIQISELLYFANLTLLTVLVVWPVFWTLQFVIMSVCLLVLTFSLYQAKKNGRSLILLNTIGGVGLFVIGVSAVKVVWIVIDKVGWAIITPHEVEHFFLGKVAHDPGWLFYIFTLTIKSTPLVFPLVFIACLLLWIRRDNAADTARQFRLMLAFVSAVFFFTVCFSLVSKKFSRYLLLVFPILDILAAVGLVEGIRWCFECFRIDVTHAKRAFVGIVCLCFLLIQVLPVFALHPYYGIYYNPFWKLIDITKITTVGDASGLDIAALYLNQKPNAEKMQVQVSPLATEYFSYYFYGQAFRADRRTVEKPAYEVVYIRDSQIGRVPQTGTLNGELEKVITLNGIDYVWIYRIENL